MTTSWTEPLVSLLLRVLGCAAGTDCTGRVCWCTRFVVPVQELPVRCDEVPRMQRTDGLSVERLAEEARRSWRSRVCLEAVPLACLFGSLFPETGVLEEAERKNPGSESA